MDPISRLNFVEAITSTNGAAGTADINGARLTLNMHRSVTAMVKFGTIAATAVTSIKWQGSDDGGSNWSDLAGTGITVNADDDDKLFISAINLPLQHDLRIVIDRGTANATVLFAWYILGDAALTGVSGVDSSSLAARELHPSPAYGTA